MGIVMLNNKVLMSGNQMALYVPPPPIVPKGSLVNLDLDGQGAKQYRVIKGSGEVVQVMAMYDTLTSEWNADISKTTTMGTLTVAKYDGSDIDIYLNTTWYNTLTSTAKAAIVPENVVCDAWYWGDTGNPDYTGTHGSSVPGTSSYTISKYADGTLNIGNRNVFTLSVQDVIDYLNDSSVQVDTSAILRNVNIWKMFWNDEVSHSGKYSWLRSSNADNSIGVWNIDGDNGYLLDNYAGSSLVVRPALNLDMSKIQYTLVQAPSVIETETWVIKDDAPVGEASLTLATTNISFTTNNQKATSIGIEHDGSIVMLIYGGIDIVAQFDLGANPAFDWYNEAYRTLVFDTPPTGNLLTWLQANATKQ